MTLSAADIVDIRRFTGYPPNPPSGVTPDQFAVLLTSLANTQPGPVSPDQVAALLAQFTALGQPLTGDACQVAIALLSPEQVTVVQTVYLVNLRQLEAAVPAAGANLDTAEAAVWKHNANEVADRKGLLRDWRLNLCRFFGIPSGDFLDSLIPAVFVV